MGGAFTNVSLNAMEFRGTIILCAGVLWLWSRGCLTSVWEIYDKRTVSCIDKSDLAGKEFKWK